MNDLTGNVNNPIWGLLKKYPGYRFSVTNQNFNNGECRLVLAITNKTGELKYHKYLSLWCISDPTSMIEQFVYHFEEGAKELIKLEGE